MGAPATETRKEATCETHCSGEITRGDHYEEGPKIENQQTGKVSYSDRKKSFSDTWNQMQFDCIHHVKRDARKPDIKCQGGTTNPQREHTGGREWGGTWPMALRSEGEKNVFAGREKPLWGRKNKNRPGTGGEETTLSISCRKTVGSQFIHARGKPGKGRHEQYFIS